MPILSTRQLATMRAGIAPLLTDSAQLLTASEVRSAGGSHTVYTPGATVAADLRPERHAPAELDQQGRLIALQLWTIRLPAGTAIDVRDRIAIGPRTFEVVGLPTRSSRELSRRVVAAEVT